jgi:hypothetical protein
MLIKSEGLFVMKGINVKEVRIHGNVMSVVRLDDGGCIMRVVKSPLGLVKA